jgi:hypothetical protein
VLRVMSKAAQPMPIPAAASEEMLLDAVDPGVLETVDVGAVVDAEVVTVCAELVEVDEVDEVDEIVLGSEILK